MLETVQEMLSIISQNIGLDRLHPLKPSTKDVLVHTGIKLLSYGPNASSNAICSSMPAGTSMRPMAF